MKALFIPEARMMFLSIAADGAPGYKLETLDDWIVRVKARGHTKMEEKQLKFRIERYGNIAHLWSSYTLQSDGKQVARGINSIQAIKESRRMASYGHHGAGRVGHCAAAQGISAVKEARLRAASRHGMAASSMLACGHPRWALKKMPRRAALVQP